MQSIDVMMMVSVELCVTDDSMMVPSPQSKAVPVKAMIQKGHFGRMTNIKPVRSPSLPFSRGFVFSIQL
jgi:hypothetical protein